MQLTLHHYWRSSASFRVRIALNLKGLDYRIVSHDLRRGEQHDPAFLALNPHGLVPALEVPGAVLTQSLAIIEWLDEVHPEPRLLPADPQLRAEARAIAEVIACDTHPLQNLRVLKALRSDHGADMAASDAWARHWITLGFVTVEALLARHAGTYALGDQPGLVDCLLVPQAFNAERFGMDLANWPRLHAVVTAARAHPAFIAAQPENQPDADPN